MQQQSPLQPTICSVTCYLRNGDDYLFMHRAANRNHEPDKFCGVGGKIESGETVLEAAARETKDETGQLISPADFIFRGTLIMEGYPERWVVTLLEATTSDRTVVTDLREGALEWIPKDKVLENNLMDDIRIYFPQFIESSDQIFGYFLFDKDNHVISYKIQQLPTVK